MANVTAATDEMLGIIREQWQYAPGVAGVGVVPLMIEHIDGNNEPRNASVWARVTVRHAEADSFALGKKYRNDGTLYVNIFAKPSPKAATICEEIAKLVIPALRQHNGDVRFTRVRFNEAGIVEGWRQVNVLASFDYYERNT